MSRHSFRKFSLMAAALGLALGVGASALAGGAHASFKYSSGYYSSGYYGGGYYPARYGHRGYYKRRRHHRRHHRHGGGKGAAIALGVIGGAIILNELAEERARERAYEERYYAREARRAARPYPAERAYEDIGPRNGNLSDDQVEGSLDGGPEPIRISADGAYNACILHARAALSERGFVLSAPTSPETAEELGDAWKMTATVVAERDGGNWSRAMYCEATEERVYLLELI